MLSESRDTRPEGRPRTCPDIDAAIENLVDSMCNCFDLRKLEAVVNTVQQQAHDRRLQLMDYLEESIRNANEMLEREKRKRLDASPPRRAGRVNVRVSRERDVDLDIES